MAGTLPDRGSVSGQAVREVRQPLGYAGRELVSGEQARSFGNLTEHRHAGHRSAGRGGSASRPGRGRPATSRSPGRARRSPRSWIACTVSAAVVERAEPGAGDHDEPDRHAGVDDAWARSSRFQSRRACTSMPPAPSTSTVMRLGGVDDQRRAAAASRQVHALQTARRCRGPAGSRRRTPSSAGDHAGEAAYLVQVAGLARPDPGLRGLHDARRPAGAEHRHGQRRGHDGLADPGVGAGDEDDAHGDSASQHASTARASVRRRSRWACAVSRSREMPSGVEGGRKQPMRTPCSAAVATAATASRGTRHRHREHRAGGRRRPGTRSASTRGDVGARASTQLRLASTSTRSAASAAPAAAGASPVS